MHNKNKILLLSHAFDLHVDLVEKHLIEMGHPYFRLNFDQFPKDYIVEYRVSAGKNEGFCLTKLSSGESLKAAEVTAVWVRKRAPYSFLSSDLGAQERSYANAEAEHYLSAFMQSLNCYWISHPVAMRAAQWKLEQLQRAQRFGLSVPDSLLTNSPDELRRFYQQHNQLVITKPLSGSSLAAEQVGKDEQQVSGTMTSLLTAEDIQQADSISQYPCFFQAYVEKSFEIRATVIGDKLFAAKIDSQSDIRTRVDYRDFAAEIDYSATELPDEIASTCVELVHSYQLQYGAIDLIYTPENEYVFLENNPAGQFWFVQQLVPELQMLEHLVHCLVKEES